MAQGTVKWFNGTISYGFIEQADASKDVFVHVNELAAGVSSLAEGQAVALSVAATATRRASMCARPPSPASTTPAVSRPTV